VAKITGVTFKKTFLFYLFDTKEENPPTFTDFI